MKRLESIQHLRGIAAMLVVFIHFPTPLARFCGSIGVDMFFLISGFIIFISVQKSQYWEKPFVFLKKRFLRIIPLYFVVTLLFIGMNLFLNFQNAEREIKIPIDLSWEKIFLSLLFIPIEKNGFYEDPLVFLGWSLNFEMLFYLLTFFGLFLFKKKYFSILFILIISLSLIGIMAGGFTDILLDFFTSPLLLYFAIGMLLGKYNEKIVRKVTPIAEPLFFVSIYVLFIVMFAKDDGYQYLGMPREFVVYNEKIIPRVIIWGIPSLLFIISYLTLATKYTISSKALTILGDRSYSIYLIQIFFIYFLMELTNMFTRYEKIALSLVFIILIVWLAGFSFRHIEKKFHR